MSNTQETMPSTMSHGRGVMPSPARATAKIPTHTPRLRTISHTRIAVNWVVGCAVFTMVVVIVLSALEVVPSGLFENSQREAEVALELAAEQPLPSTATPAEVKDQGVDIPSGDRLATIGSSIPPAAESQAGAAPADHRKSRIQEPESQDYVSKEKRIRAQAVEAIRIGDPKALRDVITLMDSLMTSPRAPQWAPKIRQQLLKRLERGQFARLP